MIASKNSREFFRRFLHALHEGKTSENIVLLNHISNESHDNLPKSFGESRDGKGSDGSPILYESHGSLVNDHQIFRGAGAVTHAARSQEFSSSGPLTIN